MTSHMFSWIWICSILNLSHTTCTYTCKLYIVYTYTYTCTCIWQLDEQKSWEQIIKILTEIYSAWASTFCLKSIYNANNVQVKKQWQFSIFFWRDCPSLHVVILVFLHEQILFFEDRPELNIYRCGAWNSVLPQLCWCGMNYKPYTHDTWGLN